MAHEFDRNFWEQHWQDAPPTGATTSTSLPPNPHLIRETAALVPGNALDAGCGGGAEATWLASNGWHVTAADISPSALERTAVRVNEAGVTDRVRLIEADLSQWHPEEQYDLVTSHYAHPAMPQLDFYARIAAWVKPGGTLLLVGHFHAPETTGDDRHPPASASVTAATIANRLDTTKWHIETADEPVRVVAHPRRGDVTLHDVVVRATRLP